MNVEHWTYETGSCFAATKYFDQLGTFPQLWRDRFHERKNYPAHIGSIVADEFDMKLLLESINVNRYRHFPLASFFTASCENVKRNFEYPEPIAAHLFLAFQANLSRL